MADRAFMDKVEKLLAKAKGTTNEHEAAAFFSKAVELMEREGITQKALDRNQIKEDVVKSTQSVSHAKDWETSLMWIVAKAFGCRLMWRKGNSYARPDYWGRHVFVGHRDQVDLAVYTGTVLLRQLTDARTQFSRKLSREGYSRSKAMTAELDGFCKGWIAVIRAKVASFANSPELNRIIEEYIAEKTKGKTHNAQDRGYGYRGHLEGQASGADAHLHRPMNMEERRMLR